MNFNKQQQKQTQGQSFQGGMQTGQQFKGMPKVEVPVTESGYRLPILLLLFVMPIIFFMMFLGVDYDTIFGTYSWAGSLGDKFWATVLIAFAWIFISETILYQLIRKVEVIKADMYLASFKVLGMMMGWYLIPQFMWYNRIWVSLLTMTLGMFVGKLLAMTVLMRKGIKQLKMAQKQMKDFQYAANPSATPPPPMSKEAKKKAEADRMTEMMKRETETLDQMLREQGIDIDALDKKYGSELDSFEKDTTIDVFQTDYEDVKTYSSDEAEVVEVVDIKGH